MWSTEKVTVRHAHSAPKAKNCARIPCNWWLIKLRCVYELQELQLSTSWKYLSVAWNIYFTLTEQKSTITQKYPTGYKQSLASFKRGKSKTGMHHKPLEPVSSCCNLLAAWLVCLPKQVCLLVLPIQQPCPWKCWVLLTFSLALQPVNHSTATVAKHSPSKGNKPSQYLTFHRNHLQN